MTLKFDGFDEVCRVDGPALANANPGWGSIVYVRQNLKDAVTNGSRKTYCLNNPGTAANGHCECTHFEMFNVRLIAVYRSPRCLINVAIECINTVIYNNNCTMVIILA